MRVFKHIITPATEQWWYEDCRHFKNHSPETVEDHEVLLHSKTNREEEYEGKKEKKQRDEKLIGLGVRGMFHYPYKVLAHDELVLPNHYQLLQPSDSLRLDDRNTCLHAVAQRL